jgi:hypothetical protein
MKGDFTRDTFHSEKHYQQVLMQQGRAQLDADWNEQAAIAARRDQTAARDLIGGCGGPADNAAFGVAISVGHLPLKQKTEWFGKLTASQQAAIVTKLAQGDFLLTAGRYYVDGIQCELEAPVLGSAQPDRFTVTDLAADNSCYLLYLDVWRRHLTALEDGDIREPALGGPDTGTRVKTVWQVRALNMGMADASYSCTTPVAAFTKLLQPSTARLTADTDKATTSADPCEVPESAGYKGLENQLYRVEIHQGSWAADGTATKPTWKWSRENGSVVTAITRMVGDTITVAGLGPDEHLGFRTDDWVEILDDALELEGKPGQLLQVVDSPAERTLKLKSAATPLASGAQFPDGVDASRHPKLRRWEGTDKVAPNQLFPLESGVQVSFDNPAAEYRTGDFWQIPARAATATATAGDIEWPRQAGQALSLPPRGITHHYCRLAVIRIMHGKVSPIADCRCLFPALTAVPRIYYVSGDGQEVMPVPGEPLAALPRPLQVYLGLGRCSAIAGAKVRFVLTDGAEGQLTSGGQTSPPPSSGQIVLDVTALADGVVECTWQLDATKWNDPILWTQQAEARLLDDLDQPLAPPIRFNASLSVANQVAYKRGSWWGPVAGDYFNGTSLDAGGQKTPDLQRLDAAINFDWGAGSPANGLPADKFSVRWTGNVRPQFSEDYTFYTVTDDGVRLWVNDVLLINHWSDQPATELVTTTVSLTADKPCKIRMEYYENMGVAVAKLFWSSPSTPKAIIPPDEQGQLTVDEALDDLFGNHALSYVSGDGQEVMPQPGQASVPLPRPLQVRVGNGRWPAPGVKVRFVLRDDVNGLLKSGSRTSTVVAGEVRLDVQTGVDGTAECTWELDPAPTRWSQQAEVWQLDPAGSPVAPPIRFNASLSLASQVAYDPQKCPDLKEAGVTTVKAAIDQLCQRTGGCETAVPPGRPLDNVVAMLLERGQYDIRLCLMPGDHVLPDGWSFDASGMPRAVNLAITGGGAATRLSIEGRPVVLRQLNSFVLRDVDVTLGTDLTLAVLQVAQVEVSSCGFSGTNTVHALLNITDAERLSVRANVMEAALTGADLKPLRVFPADSQQTLFKAANRQDFTQLVQESATNLAALPPAAKKKAIAQITTNVKKLTASMSASETTAYNGLLSAMSAVTVDPKVIAESLAGIRAAAIGAAPGLALVIAGKGAGATITDNDITGVTSLHGVPGATVLTAAELKVLSSLIKEGLINSADSDGTLQMHTNRLSRVTLGDAMIKTIKEALQAKPAELPGKLAGIYTEAFFSRNVIELGDSLFLANTASFTTNRFEESRGDLGSVFADSAVYVGNSAPNDVRLFNCSRVSQKAANMVINIVDG